LAPCFQAFFQGPAGHLRIGQAIPGILTRTGPARRANNEREPSDQPAWAVCAFRACAHWSPSPVLGVRPSPTGRFARPRQETPSTEYNPCNRGDTRLDYKPIQARMHSPLAHGRFRELTQMTSHLRRRRVLGWFAAGLLLATCGWLLMPSTQAGCSHYATSKTNPARTQTVTLERLFSAIIAPGDEWRTSPLGEHPAPPCSGFRCSGDSSTPLGVPRAVPRVDAWGCALLCAYSPRPASAPFLQVEDSPRSLDRVERLARPPR
jgi:hypothetical protein